MKYRPHEFAKLAGVTVRTLQRWDASGKLKADRTLGGHRVYTEAHVAQLKGLQSETSRGVYVYCRVSSLTQKAELENQVKAMELFCASKGLAITETIEEVGGGLNFRRKKFLKLLFSMLAGNVDTIVIAHKDRLCRFAFDLILELANYADCKILVANYESLSPQQEMVEDLISIIHCFSCRLHGLRNHAEPIRKIIDENLDKPDDCDKVEKEAQV